jgi:hypothetical protein
MRLRSGSTTVDEPASPDSLRGTQAAIQEP